MASDVDTIAAIATPPGRGGVGIVRISGPNSLNVAESMVGFHPTPRHAYFVDFKDCDNAILDQGILLYFQAPHSFTGEEVVELQGHGGPVVLDLLLKTVVSLGCRIARPGEFSERAFLNDKIDLTQAEAISDLIESGSESAAKAAIRSLQGEFSEQINALLGELIDLRVYVESALDFPDEEIDFLSSDELKTRSANVLQHFASISNKVQQGRILKEGMRVVLAGEPNVGKSSLLNALSGLDSAIVTPIPGTTRDTLVEQIHIDGMPLHIVDTAGLRESHDPVEQEGIRRAHQQIGMADRVLVVTNVEPTQFVRPAWLDKDIPIDIIINKIDLTGESPKLQDVEEGKLVSISAKTHAGIDLLKAHLKQSMGYKTDTEGTFIARRRHLDALARAQSAVETAIDYLNAQVSAELCAEELRIAQDALNEITGEFSSDDLLGKIFTSFCIGK